MKVLVVQDDPNVQTLWARSLAAMDHDIHLSDTESAALDALQRVGFDLVLMDLCMNGKNTLGVATMATYRNPRCKVVVVSGSAVYSEKKLFAMSPAVAAALRKPVNIEDLISVCERLAPGWRAGASSARSSRAYEFRC
jgi:DNA-binding NtrC family response regulator